MKNYSKTSLLIKGMSLLGMLLLMACVDNGQKEFSFGVIADCQYCDVEGTGVRKYSKSNDKLKACVDHFNTLNLEYTVHLGDFIDKDWESFDVVNPIYEQLTSSKYHVLGNHDFSVADDKKKLVVQKMGLPSAYYNYKVKDWRFVVLNGNDVSFHAYAEGSEEYNFAEFYYNQNKVTAPRWNGAVGEEQMKWLKTTLENAAANNEKVILYCHFPVYPENKHNLWNAKEIIDLMERYTCVKAYINGHNHEGNYGFKNGIHYLTMKGMVDTDETSYAVLTITPDSLKINGFGRELDQNLILRK